MEFDYTKAVEELEAIAAKVEDPQTGVDDIDKYIEYKTPCIQELYEMCGLKG